MEDDSPEIQCVIEAVKIVYKLDNKISEDTGLMKKFSNDDGMSENLEKKTVMSSREGIRQGTN